MKRRREADSEPWDSPESNRCGTYVMWRNRIVSGWVWSRPADEQEQAVEWFIFHADAPLDNVPDGTRQSIEAARAAA